MKLPPGVPVTGQADIVRLEGQVAGGRIGKQKTTVASGVDLHLQPAANSQEETIVGTRARKRYLGMVPAGTDVREGDELVMNGKAYRVEGVDEFQFHHTAFVQLDLIKTETPR
ncbi:MAG: hypothetical protein DWQ01_08615 [Planctomycetota bacterium]|nr:MAG: hypothetical protein DWQ01_08615 [Planctomycetota bacterium]